MTRMERLLEEYIPTRPDPAVVHGEWTRQEQDRHWEDLCHAVGRPGEQRPRPTPPPAEAEAIEATA